MAQRVRLQEGVRRTQGMGLGVLLVPVLIDSKAILVLLAGTFFRWFYPPATPNCMGWEGELFCEVVPDRVVAKVRTASLPVWHLVWDQQPSGLHSSDMYHSCFTGCLTGRV